MPFSRDVLDDGAQTRSSADDLAALIPAGVVDRPGDSGRHELGQDRARARISCFMCRRRWPGSRRDRTSSLPSARSAASTTTATSR